MSLRENPAALSSSAPIVRQQKPAEGADDHDELSPSFGMSATPGAPQFIVKQRRMTPKKGALTRVSASNKAAFANSTNSLFIDETPTAPDERVLTRCAARAMLVLIKGRLSGGAAESRFNEESFPLKLSHSLALPSENDVYAFLRIIYKRTRMQAECIVMMICYIGTS